jgi:hypothetical protein
LWAIVIAASPLPLPQGFQLVFFSTYYLFSTYVYAPSSFENTWPKIMNETMIVNSGTQMTFFLLNLGLKEMSKQQN